MSKKPITSLLIIQTAFMGDVILATALVEKIKQHFPDCTVDFMLRKGNEELLQGHPKINAVLIWNKRQQKLRNLWRLFCQIRNHKYQAVINVQRFASTGIVTACSGAEMKIGFSKNPFAFFFTHKVRHQLTGQHEVERNQKLIKHMTDGVSAKPKLYPTDDDYALVGQYQEQPYICIAPTSVWFTKQWPLNKWEQLISVLVEKGFVVYVLGAPSDSAMCESLEREKVINLAGKLNLLQAAALMQRATMNYVNDSAPLHLASAVNAPVTAIFCSTLPSFGFGPLSDQSRIVESTEKLSCRPCGLHGKKQCPEGHFRCANTIEIEQLSATVSKQ